MSTEATETTETMAPILTLLQYADREHRRMHAKYGVSLAEAARLYPVRGYGIEWFGYLRKQIEAGNVPSTRLWRSLSVHQQYGLLRTTRALRDDAFTRRLVSMTDQDRDRRIN